MRQDVSHPKQRWESIQYLRALAALLVVYHHARNPESWLFNPLSNSTFGQVGVDVFFVISGFIMYAAARHEAPREFIYRRITRVAPLYWCATIAALPVFYRDYVTGLDRDLLIKTVQSLLFIPHTNLAHPIEIWPMLVPGWTLNYEMFFYLVFAVALMRKAIVATTAIIIALAVTAGALVDVDSPMWSTYTDPIMLEFVAGMLAAHSICSRPLPPVAAILLPIGLLALTFSNEPGPWRVIQYGIPAIMTVVGGLAIETTGRLPSLPWLCKLGDASYALYLSHTIVIAIVGKVMKSVPLSGWSQFATMMMACIVASIAVGLAVHRWVEKPILRFLQGGRRAAVPVVAISPRVDAELLP